jgi:hypothetical protein
VGRVERGLLAHFAAGKGHFVRLPFQSFGPQWDLSHLLDAGLPPVAQG